MTQDLIVPEQLRAKARELSLPDSLAADLLAAYAPFAIAGGEVKARIAAAPTVTPAIAREARLAMVKVRTGSDKKRKELKADSLLRGKAIDGLHAMIELEATATERAMEDIEKAAERAEAARIAKLREDRLSALRPFVADPSLYAVEKMDDATFTELVESSRLAAEARERSRVEAERAAAAKAEADRKAAEEAAAARMEAAKREAAEQAKQQAEEAAARAAAIAEAKAKADLAAAAKRESDAKEAAARADREAKRQADLAQAAADLAEQKQRDQARRIEQMEADAKRRREREDQEARAAEAKEEARRKKQEDDRAAVVARIAADLAALKKAGKIGSMTALAECIVCGGLRGVTVDWDAA